MAFKFEGKEIYSIFAFAKCCWSIHAIGVARGGTKGSMPPQIFRKYSHFVL